MLTEYQKESLSGMLELERKAYAFKEPFHKDALTKIHGAILTGPGGGGKSRVAMNLISSDSGFTNNAAISTLVICHFTETAYWAKGLSDLGVEAVTEIRCGSDIRKAKQAISSGPKRSVIVCNDLLVNRLFDLIEDRMPGRVVFDSAESIKGCGLEPADSTDFVTRTFYWVVSRDLAYLGRRASGCKNFMAKVFRVASPCQDRIVVLRTPLQAFTMVNSFWYSDIPHGMVPKVMLRLMADGDADHAVGIHTGPIVTDARDLSEKTSERLRGDCPICMEAIKNDVAVVSKCCEQVFCAKCAITWHVERDRCPMCRSKAPLSSWTMLHWKAVSRIKPMDFEICSILRTCLGGTRSARVLLVVPPVAMHRAQLLLFDACIGHVTLRGNFNCVIKACEYFNADDPDINRVLLVNSDSSKMLPVRFKRVSHVILVGGISKSESDHWISRGATPQTRIAPVVFALDSILSKAFKIF